MKTIYQTLTLVAGLTITTASLAALTNDKAENFINGRGSKLTLIAKADPDHKDSGTLTGNFTTAVASKNCQQAIGKPVAISGTYVGNALALTVGYAECGAVVTMIGNMDSTDHLQMLWIDAHQGAHTDQNDWNTRMIGNDTFKVVK